MLGAAVGGMSVADSTFAILVSLDGTVYIRSPKGQWTEERPGFSLWADLWHNLSPARQDCLPKAEALGLHMRYMKARDRLWEALGHEWWPQ